MIKIKCKNCGYIKEIYNEEELYLYRECVICNSRNLEIVNLEEVIEQYIDENKRYNLQKAFNTLGIERTLEIIKKYDYLKKNYKNLVNSIFKRKAI